MNWDYKAWKYFCLCIESIDQIFVAEFFAEVAKSNLPQEPGASQQPVPFFAITKAIGADLIKSWHMCGSRGPILWTKLKLAWLPQGECFMEKSALSQVIISDLI